MTALYFSPILLGINLMAASAVACTALWYYSRPYHGPGIWTCGVLTLVLGLLLFIGDLATGSPLMRIAGFTLQLSGEALLVVGIFSFLNRSPAWWIVPSCAGAICAISSWQWITGNTNSELLLAIYSLFGALLPALASCALWLARGEVELRHVRRFVAIIFGGLALVASASGLVALFESQTGLAQPDENHSASYLLSFHLGVPLWIIALFGLALLTMRRILLDSQHNASAAQVNAKRFERLMNVANAGVLISRYGVIVDANPMLGSLFTRSHHALIGQPLTTLFDVDNDLAAQITAANGQPKDRQAIRSDGSHFSAEFCIVSLEDGSQVAEIRDVSDRKALEDELRTMATRDPLTGALNRRAFAERAEHELLRSNRQGAALCLAVFDLDHFKQINDQYGHAVGDQVLQQFSQLCQAQIRRTDPFARFGGEEFVLLLPDTDQKQATALLQRLRLSWAREIVKTSQGPLHSTVSIGLVQVDDTAPFERWFERADAALYQAKHAGRNRVEIG
ncbi:sensor domain-containing diguanylate cyclase [Pseudomonas stutzeri]|uniref:sensor domain-containing diguanylate cyclase n=1 Tax=Stutzerimonas stutzeri TaxID=316 RepID=UPI002108A122|nr:sensor domain-containing diguanylate cyclase [Stutzerimonas stutzeri]MCQ4312775.1 sensor domain-containing diguanylate cyclase [Stutzerimonas stutzeri]